MRLRRHCRRYATPPPRLRRCFDDYDMRENGMPPLRHAVSSYAATPVSATML